MIPVMPPRATVRSTPSSAVKAGWPLLPPKRLVTDSNATMLSDVCARGVSARSIGGIPEKASKALDSWLMEFSSVKVRKLRMTERGVRLQAHIHIRTVRHRSSIFAFNFSNPIGANGVR